ncbi:uncharacterized protein LOC119608801 [Lucilia sericata]|uniref:uncharacterized protein LOC119608801 n=1 Tax=Lucilia sericata TaxID=13632 RepID=UPI0018A83AFD|nr:uncharacterized protein LOC119608801 [Lucilia sericata]XP_037819263.1 uncharacterized protein LOC119608801 [Lucilia sericata]XP_037819270.1 uncharacterized protein LOC119608801 [Lucilia sericata]
MIIEQNDVELIAIKTKSPQDLDNEINFNSNINKQTDNELNGVLKDKKSEIFNEPLEEEDEQYDDDHYESSVRFIKIVKSPNGACGFHLTRTKWDPYPWVSAVDNFTPAAKSDLKAGDCVLEVNGCDVLGLRITEIAKLVKSSQHQVTLLLWSTNCNTKCDEESLCAAPMPRSLQRLSLVVQTVLSLIECPVCLDTITPPAMQCQNGHLLCVNCRIRAEKCPVCRDRYYPRPALIAEQIQSAITSAFNLCRNEDKVRQKIFGRHNRQRQLVKTTLEGLRQKQQPEQQQVHKSLTTDLQHLEQKSFDVKTCSTTTINRKCDRKVTDKFFKCGSGNKSTTCNKFLTKLLNSKAYSMENLTNGHNNTTTTNNIFNTCHTTILSAISQPQLFAIQPAHEPVGAHTGLQKQFVTRHQQQKTSSSPLSSLVTNTNQFNDLPRTVATKHHNLLTHKPHIKSIENNLNINSKLCCQREKPNNKIEHLSISSDIYLTRTKENITCLLESPKIFMNANNKRPCPTTVCETSYATIPRAIKIREKHFIQRPMCQNDVQAVKVTESSVLQTNLPKSHSSSMTSLNLSLTMSSSATIPSTTSYCCCYNCCSCSASSSCSVIAQNCQSSLSTPTSSSPPPAALSTATH